MFKFINKYASKESLLKSVRFSLKKKKIELLQMLQKKKMLYIVRRIIKNNLLSLNRVHGYNYMN